MYEAGLLHGGQRREPDATQSQMPQLLPMGCPYSINRLKTDPFLVRGKKEDRRIPYRARNFDGLFSLVGGPTRLISTYL